MRRAPYLSGSCVHYGANDNLLWHVNMQANLVWGVAGSASFFIRMTLSCWGQQFARMPCFCQSYAS